MKPNETDTFMPRNTGKRLCIWAVVIAAVLMIPFVANAPWTVSDFVFSATVLFILALIYEHTTKNMSNVKHRAVVGAIVLFTIFLIMGWAAAGP